MNLFYVIFTLMTCCAFATAIFPQLKFIASHGKSAENSENKFYPFLTRLFGLNVPKYYFTHFYIIGILCSSVYILLDLLTRNSAIDDRRHILIVLFCLHCFRRLLECLFITIYGESKIHVGGYLAGICHYISVPSSIFLSNETYYSPSNTLAHMSITKYILLLLSIFIFVLASMGQFICHNILYRLKYEVIHKPKRLESFRTAAELQLSTKYPLPTGFMFHFICCPHYFFEIIIYLSFYMIYPTMIQSSILLWVITNLSVTSNIQYQWYKQHYISDIIQRQLKRLIPFVW